jgi:predicted NAD/FAD-dependent oxidoreductase
MGATSIAPRGKALEDVLLRQLDTAGLIPVPKPIYTHHSLRPSMGDPTRAAITRYTYETGNQTLAERLAAPHDVRLSTCVASIERNPAQLFRIDSEEFDRLILAVPAPIAIEILSSIGEMRPLQHVSYRVCVSIGLGIAAELPALPYHAIIDPEQRHPLTWLSVESQKSPGRAPEGCSALVAQMSPEFSRLAYDDTDEEIVAATMGYVGRLYGQAFHEAAVFHVVRWIHSQPEMTAMFESVNRSGAKIVIAGDSVAGGRVEYAFESGVRAANLLLETQ